MTGAINRPTGYPASATAFSARMRKSSGEVPISTRRTISSGFTLIRTMTLRRWSRESSGSTMSNFVGNVSLPRPRLANCSTVQARLPVISFSSTRSLLLPISYVHAPRAPASDFNSFSIICSRLTNSLRYAHLL